MKKSYEGLMWLLYILGLVAVTLCWIGGIVTALYLWAHGDPLSMSLWAGVKAAFYLLVAGVVSVIASGQLWHSDIKSTLNDAW